MTGLKSLLKRHTLWAGFVAVLAPLVVLLSLQFVWLAKLKRVSAIADQAALSNYLEAIGTEVQYFYRSSAEQALNVPADSFVERHLDSAAAMWDRRPVEGASRLFLVDYTKEPFGRFLLFDPASHRLQSPPASDETLAIIVACNPWQLLSYRGGAATPGLRVDERNADYRIILNPITDEASHVVGIAGMILDPRYFTETLLPRAIKKALPGFFPDAHVDDLVVSVRDGHGRPVLTTRQGAEGSGPAAVARFPFVFEEWTLSLHSLRSSPEKWARASFVFNITLSTLLAAALIGGIVLALRAASRAVTLSEMKSEFVSNVSHELRTPLASIRIFAELLRLGRVDSQEKIREYGATIEAESRRLSRLIENILDFSRIESGRKTYRMVPSDLHEIVASTLRTFEMQIKEKGFRISLATPSPVAGLLPVDPDAIGQAIHNLIDNAVKYSGGSREITVSLEEREGEVVISVEDRGIGIPMEDQGRIFDRFHRVATGLVHEVKGSGLGLSIVDHIARVHQGRVTVDSAPGRGSVFSIHLPRIPSGGA
jgi:signal transduction histidine kinase